MNRKLPLLRFFCVAEMVGALASFSFAGNNCKYLYDVKECNDAEIVYKDYNALWKLQVAVLLSALCGVGVGTTSSSFVWLVTLIALANLCGMLMFGSFLVDGLMPTGCHFVLLLYSLGMFAALFHAAVSSDNDSKPTTTTSSGNDSSTSSTSYTRKYLLVVAAYFILWVFVNSDGSVCTETILDAKDFSPLAVAHWNYWSVATLENALIFAWAATVAPEASQEEESPLSAAVVTTRALVGSQIPALVLVNVLKPITTADIYYKTSTSFVVIALFGIWTAHRDDVAANKAKRN